MIFSTAELTCYTCPKGALSNAKCNSQAVDLPCDPGLKFCMNRQIVNADGMTLLVTKKCVDKNACIDAKGCKHLKNGSKVSLSKIE